MVRTTTGRAGILLLASVTVLVVAAPVVTAAGTELRIGTHTDEGPLTPYGYTFGYPGLQLVRLTYDSLFIMDRERRPVPWLVREYEVSEDGKRWTLRLHEGIKFHDGSDLTSADVKFTYTYMTRHAHAVWQRALRGIEAIETPDPFTVEVRLAAPQPLFALRPLAEVPILPAHIWEGVTDPRAFTDATGSGPYRLAEYRPGHFYRFEAHPDYFHPEWKPAVGTIVMPIIPDATTLFTALRAGQVDMATRVVPPELVEELRQAPGVAVQRGPSFVSTLLQINAEREPFDRVEFRRALALAVDVQNLVDTIQLGYATAGGPGFVHPMSAWLLLPGPEAQYDPDRARSLLEGIGFTDRTGDGLREDPAGMPFKQTILVYADRADRVRAAEILAEAFRAIGLRTEVKAMEAGTVDSLVWPEFDVTKGRDYDLAMWGWSAGIQENPLSLRELVHSQGSLNIGAFSDPEVDQVADRLLVATGIADFGPVVSELARLVADRVPFVTLWYPDGIYAYRPEAYDGWVYVKGLGILDKLSLVTRRVEVPEAAPVAEPPPARQRGWAWLLLAAAAGAAVVLFGLRRARPARP